MKIYVESRGFSQDYDYRWFEVTKTEQKRHEALPYILRKVNELIESDAPSVVLARNGLKGVTIRLKTRLDKGHSS